MSETFFPINDLIRRKLQTGIAIVSLTICVASTLFLLLFSEQIGLALTSLVQGRLTSGFSVILSQYILFAVALIFIMGAVTVSFLGHLMMSQRVKDIGLMKMAGCPSNLAFGFFINELFLITVVGCVSGTAIGILADYLSMNLAGSLGLTFQQKTPDLWIITLVFISFFVLSLVLGGIPVFKATNVEPTKAISSAYHSGTDKEKGFNVVSRRGIALRIGFRSLVRHKAVSIRAILCLTIVFVLVTVAIAGGIIASSTTESWVEKAIGRDTVLIAHQDMANQYQVLLSRFFQSKETTNINYTNSEYAIPQKLTTQLEQISGIAIDPRLILELHVKEHSSYTIDSDSGNVTQIGDSRQGESLIVGVKPGKLANDWFTQGTFFQKNDSLEAVIGDSLGVDMFSAPLNESIELDNATFQLTGVCMDPINNGNVTYVPLSTLQNITGITEPNVLLVRIDAAANRDAILKQINDTVNSTPNFKVLELDNVLNDGLSFLSNVWFIATLAPLFSVIVAGLCMLSYALLAVSEQHNKLGVLRALGVRPRSVVSIVSWQNLVVLFASYGFGVAFGIITTLLILVPEPVITEYAVFQIAASLLAVLATVFLISLLPALRFARKPIIKVMAQC